MHFFAHHLGKYFREVVQASSQLGGKNVSHMNARRTFARLCEAGSLQSDILCETGKYRGIFLHVNRPLNIFVFFAVYSLMVHMGVLVRFVKYVLF